MDDLIHLQNQFQEYLLQDNEQIIRHIVSTDKVPAEVRLGIYSHAYRARLVEALAASYSVLQKVLGEETFEELAFAYIEDFPSANRSIRWFGDKLSDFLLKRPQYKLLPHLSELAQFEWAMGLVFDSEDSNIVSLEEIAAIPPHEWMEMRLYAHPSAHRLKLNWNVVPIWQSMTEENTLLSPERSATEVDWIIWRQELTTQFSSLPEDEAWAIDAMIKTLPFGEICEGLCYWHEEDSVVMRAASLLKGWVSAGLIAAIQV